MLSETPTPKDHFDQAILDLDQLAANAADQGRTATALQERCSVHAGNLTRQALLHAEDKCFGEGVTRQSPESLVDDTELEILAYAKPLAAHEKRATIIAEALAALLAFKDEPQRNARPMILKAMRLSVALAGSNSLQALVARHSLIVANRHFFPLGDFLGLMRDLRDEAMRLADDSECHRLRERVKKTFPAGQRLPAPGRLASSALGNASSMCLTRMFLEHLQQTSELATANRLLREVREMIEDIRGRDPGFPVLDYLEFQLRIVEHEVVNHGVFEAKSTDTDHLDEKLHADLSKDMEQLSEEMDQHSKNEVAAFLRQYAPPKKTSAEKHAPTNPVSLYLRDLGKARTTELIQQFLNYENCEPLLQAAEYYVEEAFPELLVEVSR